MRIYKIKSSRDYATCYALPRQISVQLAERIARRIALRGPVYRLGDKMKFVGVFVR